MNTKVGQSSGVERGAEDREKDRELRRVKK